MSMKLGYSNCFIVQFEKINKNLSIKNKLIYKCNKKMLIFKLNAFKYIFFRLLDLEIIYINPIFPILSFVTKIS